MRRWRKVICLFVISFSALSLIFAGSFTYNVLKPQFEEDFNRSCSKYPFVQNYVERMENPSGNAVTFEFQMNGWNNGGLGDRLAGLITATEMAIRFNRSLIIRSDCQFDKLFRPYVPTHLENTGIWKDITYNYDNLTWAKYNKSNEYNDATELEMYNCVNIGGQPRNDFCTQAWGNPSQPNMITLSNRAFLCRIFNSPEYVPAHQLFKKNIGNKSDDLMEIGGCMLRLVMWPTDLLWSEIDEAIESHKMDLKRAGKIKHHDQSSLWKYIISLHFRCGDLSYRHRGAYDLACQHSEVIANITTGNDFNVTYNIPPHPESNYMVYGTPLDVGRCALKVLKNLTTESSIGWQTFIDNQQKLRKSDTNNNQRLRRRLHPLRVDGELEYQTIVHIASDSAGSAMQMNETVAWPNTLVSPTGCHIQMDASFECLRVTVVYWMIMSLSQIIVTTGGNGLPNSGFSRYAAIYGLKGDTLRDAKNCENILPRRNQSHIQYGNWVCY